MSPKKKLQQAASNTTEVERPRFEVELQTGVFIAITESRSGSPDFRSQSPCSRCGGHGARDTGQRMGGILLLLVRSDFGYWEQRPAACSCVFGAWLHKHQRLHWYDDHPLRLEGLMRLEIDTLAIVLPTKPDLTSAVESLLIGRVRDRIEIAVEGRLAREQFVT